MKKDYLVQVAFIVSAESERHAWAEAVDRMQNDTPTEGIEISLDEQGV